MKMQIDTPVNDPVLEIRMEALINKAKRTKHRFSAPQGTEGQDGTPTNNGDWKSYRFHQSLSYQS